MRPRGRTIASRGRGTSLILEGRNHVTDGRNGRQNPVNVARRLRLAMKSGVIIAGSAQR
jgi:hypothetical protein